MPRGFKGVDDDAKSAAPPTVMKAELFRDGAMVRYMGLRSWKGGDNKEYSMHVIVPPEVKSEADDAAGAAIFGLWPTAQLDRLLLKVARGEVVYLRYNGKEPHPTIAGKEQHSWTVARADGAPPVNRVSTAEPLEAPALPAAFRVR